MIFIIKLIMIIFQCNIMVKSQQPQNKVIINVGLLFAKDTPFMKVAAGYRTSASAVLIAKDRIKEEHILDGFDFNFTVEFDECSESLVAGSIERLVRHHHVDVILGPTCNRPGIIAGALGKYYNVPIFSWALANAPEFTGFERFPTAVTVSIDSSSLAFAIQAILFQYDWSSFVYVYSNYGDDEKCDRLKDDLLNVVSSTSRLTMTYLYKIGKISVDSLKSAVRAISKRGRIIVVCFAGDHGYTTDFMSTAYSENAATDEYIYIVAETKSRGFYIEEEGGGWHYVWEDQTGLDTGITVDQAWKSFQRIFYIVDNMGLPTNETKEFTQFSEEVIRRMKEPPFNCVEECSAHNYSAVATYASQLFDSLYCYAIALNRSIADNKSLSIKDGFEIMKHIGYNYTGVQGLPVVLSEDGSRLSRMSMFTLNSSRYPQKYADILVEKNMTTFIPYYDHESQIFVTGKKPLDIPICGFTGDECPIDFWSDYLIYVIIVVIIIILLILAAVAGIIYTIYLKRQEAERENKVWQIAFAELHTIKRKTKSEASMRSFASGPSVSTKLTADSKLEDDHFDYYTYYHEIVAVTNHPKLHFIEHSQKAKLRQLTHMDHDNINKFLGICTDAPSYCLSVWKYCSRGSLAHVIQNSSMQMDGFFIFSLIRDISHGIGYIHASDVQVHGHLTSRCCLIDERWQVKISEYGLDWIGKREDLLKKELLWCAPELLRNENNPLTKECDIYSFAIICSEIITKSSAFDLDNRKEKAEDIIYLLKKGGYNLTRPSLESDDSVEINPALIHLVRDCWAERPSERPNIQQVNKVLKGMHDGRKANLMDHVFNMLETYASTLEEEVSERTKELVEEKKKSDVLLSRMLPKSVAEKLRLGQTVEPESFDLVTVFFSDVVKFTNLAARSTALQVVNLVNDLYTVFDNIIEQHDVYKVETIGDGYLCVSGLPHRNGNEHCRHIARMALGFMASLEYFRVPHLPAERINLRIGINCGPVVAGVVGLTMPRYCLFGDAVNTASRMESNGKPGHIHISSDVNHLLTQVVGGFITESRGDVIIKGKGVMETFWLIGEKDSTITNHDNNKITNNEQSNIHSIMKQPHKTSSPLPKTPPMIERSMSEYNMNDQSSGMYSLFKNSKQ